MLTPTQIRQYKVAYNQLITRHGKAETYLGNQEIPQEVRDRYVPEFQKLTENLCRAIKAFHDNGIEMTDDEVLGGFKSGLNM